ncbi:MAG: lasso peptide biosynthesis PqqD family chaperone [Desulfosporosinus sp.]|nr:lasso peptide biosynthesis PqqD family chaperone [Desulfosporosinus sp.]
MEKITLQSVISAKKDIVTADMDGEVVMLSIESGKYYNLGNTGGVIWEVITDPITVEQVIDNLVDNYDVSRGQCEEEVLAFLRDAHQEGLLERQ